MILTKPILYLALGLSLLACKDDKKDVVSSSSQNSPSSSWSDLQASSSATSAIDAPKLQGSFGQQVLLLGTTAQTVLHNFDPQFKAWEHSDYLPQITTLSPEEPKPTAQQLREFAPFAIVKDLNHDQRVDLIIHGRNNHQERFLALLSNAQGYQVEPIKDSEFPERNGITDPKVDDWDQGKKKHGLACDLVQNGDPQWQFAITCAQLADSTGEILNDPMWTDFRWSKGKWQSKEAEL